MDDEDKCPEEPGVARHAGCPVGDLDGDGINDDDDACKNEFGVASNKGCPEKKTVAVSEVALVSKAARHIYFETGSAKLKAVSNKALDEVVALLAENSGLMITVEGHTDNAGSPQLNQQLSTNRAAAVKQYFISKGVAENTVDAKGFGASNPVSSNKSAVGRAANRRVVLRLDTK